MRAIRKDPGEMPRIVEIPNTLAALQDAVGGYIEAVTFCEDVSIICNEEGRLLGLPHNCSFLGAEFAGPILLVGVSGDEFSDLSDATVEPLMRALGGE